MGSRSQCDDIDEWDPSRGSFINHAIAGSFAGLAEHSLMFPVDTVKTHMQVRAQQLRPAALSGAAELGIWPTLARMYSAQGVARMWCGVQTMLSACVPAHAAYFSIYEGTKPELTQLLTPTRAPDGGIGAAVGAGVAVSLGTMAHDIIMTPMDVCKQRLQLGHHKNSVFDCACEILRREGARAFVVSYPITLLMNLPFALVMGSTNEALRQMINPSGEHSLTSYFLAGAGAGTVAAAATNPLDVIKTRLQTQHVGMAPCAPAAPAPPAPSATRAGGAPFAPSAVAFSSSSAPGCGAACNVTKMPIVYRGILDTARSVLREEGWRAFMHGANARMLIHAPSVAICWTTYETVKHWLGWARHTRDQNTPR